MYRKRIIKSTYATNKFIKSNSENRAILTCSYIEIDSKYKRQNTQCTYFTQSRTIELTISTILDARQLALHFAYTLLSVINFYNIIYYIYDINYIYDIDFLY